jgi:hypothetical protein
MAQHARTWGISFLSRCEGHSDDARREGSSNIADAIDRTHVVESGFDFSGRPRVREPVLFEAVLLTVTVGKPIISVFKCHTGILIQTLEHLRQTVPAQRLLGSDGRGFLADTDRLNAKLLLFCGPWPRYQNRSSRFTGKEAVGILRSEQASFILIGRERGTDKQTVHSSDETVCQAFLEDE